MFRMLFPEDFIYMKESKELVKEVKNKTKFLIERKIVKDKSFYKTALI